MLSRMHWSNITYTLLALLRDTLEPLLSGEEFLISRLACETANNKDEVGKTDCIEAVRQSIYRADCVTSIPAAMTLMTCAMEYVF